MIPSGENKDPHGVSEVTFSLEKAKRDNVTGRVVREKDKARALDRSRETISGIKESPLSCTPTYGPPALLLDDVPVSTGENRPLSRDCL